MLLLKKQADLHNYLEEQHKKGKSIGFVPTMGALHHGHTSLIETSVKENDITVCSIFVNPTQFNDPKDYEKYPVTIDQDIYKLETSGCNILFLPPKEEIYNDSYSKNNHYALGYLETVLEGKFRPGHFQGVCMVVHRLLQIVTTDRLYLGQKDYQQCMVIKKLLELIHLDKKIELKICPTVREADGLAMSSRNMRLNERERKTATTLFQSLSFIKKNLNPGPTKELTDEAKKILAANGFRIDYVDIADANDLEMLDEWDGKRKIVALVAAFLNEVRLIDNMLLN